MRRNYHEESILIVAVFVVYVSYDTPDFPTVVVGWSALGVAVVYWLARTIVRVTSGRG